MVSLSGSGVAVLLLLNGYFRGHRRFEPALTWTLALVVCVFLGGFLLKGDFSSLAEVAARISCGVLWILWLGTPDGLGIDAPAHDQRSGT